MTVELFVASILIFIARVADYSMATMRFQMTSQGRKGLAWIFGFSQALIFVVVAREVLVNIEHVAKLVAYAAGFATGNVTGMLLETKLALGFIQLQIVSNSRGGEMAREIRNAGYGVTELPGRGRDGTVNMVLCTIRRRELKKIETLINEVDDQAFVISQKARSVERGYWQPRRVRINRRKNRIG